MHRIDSVTAGPGNSWVGSNQITGVKATNFNPSFQNDLQENVCKFIESQGIALAKDDYDQLTDAINSGFGRKRNLNFNSAFFQTEKWGGLSAITTPIATMVKLPPTGWNILSTSTISATGDITISPSPDGLSITGVASSSGGTIVISQFESRLNDATFGNDTQTGAGEVKRFTSSVKYKKVSGSDFTIRSVISSISTQETIIVDEFKNSATDGSIGTAYRHAEVNTKDLGVTPIVGCGFEITLASAGAFEIQIKNCDMTEGFTLPDYQTYGDAIADEAFSIAKYGADNLEGKFYGYVPVSRATGSDTFSVIGNIPVPSQKIKSGDTVNVTNVTIDVLDSVTNGSLDLNTFAGDSDVNDGRVDFLGLGTLSSPTGVSYIALLSYDWEWIAS